MGDFMEITIDNIKINYIIEGESEKPVLILHGWGASIEAVMGIVNALKDTRRVIAIDLPGHGKSFEPDRVFGGEDYANIVKAFVEKLGIKKFDAIGHSFGGKTLIQIASEGYERLDKMVLIDASGILPKRSLSYYLKVYTYKFFKKLYRLIFFYKSEEELMKKLSKKFGSDDYKNTSGIMRKTFVKVVNESLLDRLDSIKNDTLILWGKDDDTTPLYMGKIMNEKIKNSALVELEGGHFSYADDYQIFSRVIRSYLSKEELW